jgi:NADH-quinone oxidoreductase subunit N
MFLFSYSSFSISLFFSFGFFLFFQYFFFWKGFCPFEVPVLFFFSIFGLYLIFISDSLISVYLALELYSLPLYVLVAFTKSSYFSSEAGLKFFVLGIFSSSFFLFGSVMLYGVTGTFSFNDLIILLEGLGFVTPLVVYSIVLLLISFFFKLSLAPFHFWAPDVYEVSSFDVISFLAVVSKFSLFFFLFKLFLIFPFSFSFFFVPLLFFVALFSIVFGTLAALFQRKVSKLLAYSSLVHGGFILLSVFSATYFGFASAFFYLFFYVVTGYNVFSMLITLRLRNSQSCSVYMVEQFNSMIGTNPIFAVQWFILIFSFIGIPPFFGFFAKLYVLFSLISVGYFVISFFVVVLSFIGAVYYLRLVKVIFFDKIRWDFFYPTSFFEVLSVIPFMLINLLLFFGQTIFYGFFF